MQKYKHMLLVGDWSSSLQTLEADSVTHAQLQNVFPSPGTSGSIISSAVPLAELPLLCPICLGYHTYQCTVDQHCLEG